MERGIFDSHTNPFQAFFGHSITFTYKPLSVRHFSVTALHSHTNPFQASQRSQHFYSKDRQTRKLFDSRDKKEPGSSDVFIDFNMKGSIE